MAITRWILLAQRLALCPDQEEERVSSNSQACNETVALGLIAIAVSWKSQRKIDGDKAVTAILHAKMAQDIA